MAKENKTRAIFWLISLFCIPIILWMLPANIFDEMRELCLSRVVFDAECLLCGMFRAVMHFHHLDFEEAIYYNILVVLVYPGLVAIWCLWLYKSYKKLQ